MPSVVALLAPDPGGTIDVPTGSKADLQLPPLAAGPIRWTKNGQPFVPPQDSTVDPTLGGDDLYLACGNQGKWSVVVRWQPDAPASVALSPGKDSATVEWSAIPGENRLSYYEITLDPAPPTLQLPRHAMQRAGTRGTQRKLAIDGVPPDFYGATVRSVRVGSYGPVASGAAATEAPAEVGSGGHALALAERVFLTLVALGAVAGAVALLLTDPRSGTPSRVSLNGWALGVGALIVFAILLFLTCLVSPMSLLLGADNRVSTSRVNVAIWTVAIAFGITTLAAFAFGAAKYHIRNPCGVMLPSGKTTPAASVNGICVNGKATAARLLDLAHTFKGGLTPNYLVLLGAPFATLAGAAFIVNRQVGTGDRQKVPSAGPAQFSDALTNDDGTADLVDSQYLTFTCVLLFYFMTSFLPRPSTLPVLPWGLVGLTGVSAGTYLLNKSVATNGLTILGFASSTAARGQSDRILGQNFLPEGSSALPNGGVSVVIDGTDAPVVKVTNSEISFGVPTSLVPQTYNVQVTTAANVTGTAGPLTVT